MDTKLLAFLSRTRAAHHSADRAEERGDLVAATAVLSEVVTGPSPNGASATEAPEVREVLADTLARLADLESRAGRFEAAVAHIERGLTLVPEISYFRGHLYEVSGLMWERRASALRSSGDSVAADRATARALESLEKAMKVQAEVIRGAPAPAPSR